MPDPAGAYRDHRPADRNVPGTLHGTGEGALPLLLLGQFSACLILLSQPSPRTQVTAQVPRVAPTIASG